MTTIARKRVKFELDMQEGWSTFIFLSLILIIVTGAINEAGYDAELSSLIVVTLGALVAGLFLAKSHFPGPLAHLFSLIYGVAWNAFIISYRLPETFTAREKLLEMGFRIADWLRDTVIGGALGTDPLMFTVVMSVLSWLLAYLAIWCAFRVHSLWATLLPSCITLTLNLYYGPERIGFFIVPFTLLALLFTARLTLYLYERDWRQNRIRYGTDMAYTFLRYATILSLIAIVLAWVIPTAATNEDVEVFVSRFSEPWDRVKSEWIRIFSTLQSERAQPTYASFGGTLTLGGPVSLGNATVMDVRSPAGRYWRAAVYDRYAGDGWISTVNEAAYLDPGAVPGDLIEYEARRVITQTFTLYTPGATQLYALSQPEKFSMPVKADYIGVTSPGGELEIETIAMVSSRYKLKEVESYMVISTIPSAAVDAMQQAGDGYPEWIERYLQLPDSLPQRVRDLAAEITAGYDNDFDKATAIQDFLREYEYNEKIAMPPADVDRVDYFLFEMKQGYCNYYASAMAVMARSVGIPARIAAGYARGEYDRDLDAFRVREHNSHAWVEVFLPRFGWIEFEPTASEPVLVRPRSYTGGDDTLDNGSQYWEDYLDNIPEDAMTGGGVFNQEAFDALMAEQRRQNQIRTATRIGGVVLISVAIILLAWWQGRRQLSEERPAYTFYEKMVRRASWWGLKMEPVQTPNEYAHQLSTAIAVETGDFDAGKLIGRITEAYVGERFGKKNPGRFQPNFAWRDLRPILSRWGLGYMWKKTWRKEAE
ncbi:MAG: hypothetical protein JXA89_21690 [Anaerolineae bacterium]|nr:hypothetical protein [Anaerolineae bacterium]